MATSFWREIQTAAMALVASAAAARGTGGDAAALLRAVGGAPPCGHGAAVLHDEGRGQGMQKTD